MFSGTGCCAARAAGATPVWTAVFVVLICALLIAGLIAAVAGFRAELKSDGGDDGSGPGGPGPDRPRPQDPGPGGGDPVWWPEFERQFAAYVNRVGVGRVAHPAADSSLCNESATTATAHA